MTNLKIYEKLQKEHDLEVIKLPKLFSPHFLIHSLFLTLYSKYQNDKHDSIMKLPNWQIASC